MYRNYMLCCQIKSINDNTEWIDRKYFFNTKKEMICFVHKQMESFSIRIESAFKISELDNSIFVNV